MNDIVQYPPGVVQQPTLSYEETIARERAIFASMKAEAQVRQLTTATDLPRNWPHIGTWEDRVRDHEGDVEYLVPDLIPRGLITTLFGRDGIGKSFLMMYVSMCLAVGRCPLTNDSGGTPLRVWFLSTEDPERAIVSRFKAISESLCLDPYEESQLSQNFVMPQMKGIDTCLQITGKGGQPTASQYARMLERALDQGAPDLLAMDPISDLFRGNQNAANDVAPFLWYCETLADRYNMALALIGHPAKDEESRYAGHSLWSSKSRSRLFLFCEKNVTWLEQDKRTNGPKAKPIRLKWNDGVLAPVSELEQGDTDRAIRQAIEEGLPHWAARGEVVSVANTAPNKMHKMLPDYDEADVRRITGQLCADGTLRTVEFDGTDNVPDIRNKRNVAKKGVWWNK
ncbi:AAA family ATPase [uncultured Shimia sp.]|uniref:AAA family ATPase n=1 Tax=uncultured Shimia sp. TaxID=573152 RepID=UPI002611CBCF|nr:AAA family ATPase [uncultured Shimia sp.]